MKKEFTCSCYMFCVTLFISCRKLFELLVLSSSLAELSWPAILSKRHTFRYCLVRSTILLCFTSSLKYEVTAIKTWPFSLDFPIFLVHFIFANKGFLQGSFCRFWSSCCLKIEWKEGDGTRNHFRLSTFRS